MFVCLRALSDTRVLMFSVLAAERAVCVCFLTRVCSCLVCVCVVVGGEVTAAQHLVCQAWLGNRVGRASAFSAAEAMLSVARSDAHRPHWGGLDTIKLTTH